MNTTSHIEKYDLIFVGSGLIAVLEAVYQSLCGKSVLMIDRQSDMGGAWLSLEIFGLHDVENAIHYFLPDQHAFDFMRSLLTWEVVPSQRKYRAFKVPLMGYVKLSYDNVTGRLLGRIWELMRGPHKRKVFRGLLRAIKDSLTLPPSVSYYVRGGTPEMLTKVKAILRDSDVKITYSTEIETIHIDTQSKSVDVFAGGQRYCASAIVLTHGSHIPKLTTPAGTFPIPAKYERRPAMHLLVQDPSPTLIYECIFTVDPIIKYVHDVTRLTREAAQLTGRKKLFVLGLHKSIEKSDDIYSRVFTTLKHAGLVSKGARLENQHWWDAYLPPLEDADLARLKSEFRMQVEYLKTENFSRGIGYYAPRWATKIRFPEDVISSRK